MVLVKPQFEVGRGQVGRGGIVKDPALHLHALRTVAAAAHARIGLRRARRPARRPSPGTEGNREFFLHLRARGEGMTAAALAEADASRRCADEHDRHPRRAPTSAAGGPALRDLVALAARAASTRLPRRAHGRADRGGSPRQACTRRAPREVAAHADALVVLGGDGTLLAASHLLERPVPVLGVNFGSLGFLTEITLPELYPTLEGVLDGNYRYEERRMLRAVVASAAAGGRDGDVLNDVVITKAALSRIIELDVTSTASFVSAFRADGLIISSPDRLHRLQPRRRRAHPPPRAAPRWC